MTDDLARLQEDVSGLRRPLHELGNLLAIVVGQAEYLLHEGEAPDRDEALEAIRRAALDARDRIRQIQSTVRQVSGVTSPPAAPNGNRAPNRKASRVLIIDDEIEVRETFATLFRQMGHEVETTGVGDDGIRRYRAQPFDCVVTDLVMPGLNGLAVSRAIKAHDPRAYVVLLTGVDAPDDAAAIRAAGVDRVAVKPLSRAEIIDLVRRAG